MIECKELNQSFETKEELFKALRDNAKDIISLKCSEVHKSSEKGQAVESKGLINKETTKGTLELKEDNIYPVINTIGYLDSHRDLHVKGIWNKSAKEQNGRIHYVSDHSLKIADVIAWKADVNVLVKDVRWTDVGYKYAGYTEALVFEIPKNKLRHKEALQIINDGLEIENSVRMQYVKIVLCYDSEEKEDLEYKENFDKYYSLIQNKEDFENLTYFYAVLEAKIVSEGSMVVAGSNSATRVLQNKHIESQISTQKETDKAVESQINTLEAKDKLSIYSFN